jgi:hypothetical protein
VVDKQKERFESALNFARDFERKYPRSDYGRDIKTIIDTSEKKLKSIADGRYQEQGSGDRS